MSTQDDEYQIQMNDAYDIESIVERKVAEILSDPVKALEIYKKRTEMLESDIKQLQPKADFYDTVIQSETEFIMRDVAKILNFKNMGQNKLFKYLRKKKVLNHNNMPYQHPHVDAGRFSYKESTWINPQTGETNINKTPVVTQKGIDYIRRLLENDGYEYNKR